MRRTISANAASSLLAQNRRSNSRSATQSSGRDASLSRYGNRVRIRPAAISRLRLRACVPVPIRICPVGGEWRENLENRGTNGRRCESVCTRGTLTRMHPATDGCARGLGASHKIELARSASESSLCLPCASGLWDSSFPLGSCQLHRPSESWYSRRAQHSVERPALGSVAQSALRNWELRRSVTATRLLASPHSNAPPAPAGSLTARTRRAGSLVS